MCIRDSYTDGVYEMTDVEWEDIAPELYNKNGIFTVGGSAGGLDVEVQVLVVSGEQIQLEQLPDTKADSIMGDGNSTWLPVSSLITNPEPTTSSNLGGGAWQNWGHSSQDVYKRQVTGTGFCAVGWNVANGVVYFRCESR